MPVETLADHSANAHAYALTFDHDWAHLPLRDQSVCVSYVDPAKPEDTARYAETGLDSFASPRPSRT